MPKEYEIFLFLLLMALALLAARFIIDETSRVTKERREEFERKHASQNSPEE